jgi:hypothetical protein
MELIERCFLICNLGKAQVHLISAGAFSQGFAMIFFVHVGKTGGTAIKRQIRAFHNVKKRKEPQVIGQDIVLLNHLSLAVAVREFGEPDGIAFSYRDPTERFVSGFYCRQRMGFPDHKAVWDAREAAAFAHFDTANELAQALDSDDLKQRAAAHYAMSAIRHLRRGYQYHFGHMADFFADYSDRVKACIETKEMDQKSDTFLARIGVDEAKQQARSAPDPRAYFPRELSDVATRNLRTFWAEEYAYFDAFKMLDAQLDDR